MQFGRGRAQSVALPEDDVRTLAVLGRAPRHPLTVHTGCPTWANAEWIGSIYPAGAKSSDWLRHYGAAFNGIELNATHYRLPDADTVQRWRDTVPSDFRFAPKFPQEVSHAGDLRAAVPLALQFATVIGGLGDRLGRAFLQLPPSAGPGVAPALRVLLSALPPELPLAVEFRHSGWFAQGRLTRTAFDLLAEMDAAAVITDAPGRRDVVHSSLPRPVAFVRYLAALDPVIDGRRLDDWCVRIARWRDAGLSEVYFWLHTTECAAAPPFVNEFRARLDRLVGISVRGPRPQPGQLRLF